MSWINLSKIKEPNLEERINAKISRVPVKMTKCVSSVTFVDTNAPAHMSVAKSVEQENSCANVQKDVYSVMSL